MSPRPRRRLRWAVVITILVLAQFALPTADLATHAQESAATPPAEPVAAEEATGSVFVADEWRIAVVAARRAPGIAELDLRQSPDKTWLVIVADVTNWSDDSSNLDVRRLRLRFFNATDPGGFAPQSTERVAAELQTEPASVDAGIDFEADETRRVTVVFLVDSDFGGPVLLYGNEALPLDLTLAAPVVDLQALPEVISPPSLERVLVEDVVSGGELSVIRPSADENRPVQLSGVDAPTGADCLATEATAALAALAGTVVFLEGDPSAVDDDEGDAPLARYVWTENDGGQRTLVNEVIIETGFARWAADSAPTRFDAWLQEAERIARRNAVGLWANCTGPQPQPQPQSTEASPAAATPEPADPTPTSAPPTATAIPEAEPTTTVAAAEAEDATATIAQPEAEPTATAAPAPTETPVPEPTSTPLPDPTCTPVPEPTATAEPEPTATAEPEPTGTPLPESSDASTPLAGADDFPASVAALVAEDDPDTCDRIGWSAPSSASMGEARLEYHGACAETGGVYVARCAEAPEGIGGGSPLPDHVWLICAIAFQNAGEDPLYVDPFDFTLVDGDDGRYGIDPEATEAMPPARLLNSGEIEPDGVVLGAIAFEHPADAPRPLRLEIAPLVAVNAGDADPAVIIIEIYVEQ